MKYREFCIIDNWNFEIENKSKLCIEMPPKANDIPKSYRVIEYKAYTNLLKQKQESDKVIKELIEALEYCSATIAVECNCQSFKNLIDNIRHAKLALAKAKAVVGE